MMRSAKLQLLIVFISIFFFSCKKEKDAEGLNKIPHGISVILDGDYPDPSIVKDGDDYYMTYSSMSINYPNLIIWHSKDLLHWEKMTCPLNTDLNSPIWAVDFVKHEDLFYIYMPIVNDDFSIYVITAKNPAGPWSDPVKVEGIRGIDPGHVAGKDGKRYMLIDNGRIAELSADGLSIVGEEKKIYDGWKFDDSYGVECFCLEAPKSMYHNGYYYMISAQGGTAGPATSHMAVVARSESEFGPYENSPYNPLIKTWSPYEQWHSKGHATIVEGPDKKWYAFYHGYENGNMPAGRKLLMEPVEWTSDGWIKSSLEDASKAETYYFTENARPKSDDFSASKLDLQWMFTNYSTYSNSILENGELKMHCSDDRLSALMHKICDRDFDVSFKIIADSGVEAGLVMMYKPDYYTGIKVKDNTIRGTYKNEELCGNTVQVSGVQYLKMSLRNYNLYLSYSVDGKDWKPYPEAFDISAYHTNNLGGFGALKFAVIGKGDGYVLIDDFKYEVFKK